jgi:hypothetical protein
MTNAEDDGEAAWHFIEPYWDKLNIYDDAITYLSDLEMLPLPVRHLLTVWRCDSEICNGGLNQLFFNSTGILAPEAVEGFRAIGLDECSCCIDSAIRQFGELYPRDREARMLLLAGLERAGEKRAEWDPFYSLDDEYYSIKKRLGYEKLIDEYARKNIQ